MQKIAELRDMEDNNELREEKKSMIIIEKLNSIGRIIANK